jgi:hypothetical protein
MRRVALSVALLLAATSAGHSESMWVNGQEFAQNHCEKNQVAANRYVVGLMDGFATGSQISKSRGYCTPPSATAGQATAVACKYAREHPTEWHVPAAYLVIQALQDAWPCND